jgi:ABC-2 type transport system permease protein
MIQAQLIKLKRTPFVWYLILSTAGVLAVFLLYNSLYSWKPVQERLQFLFEIYGAALPLLHGLTVFFLINPDEQIANMYGLLTVKNRTGMFMTLVSIVWGIESLRLALVFLISGIQSGIQMTGLQIFLFGAGEIVLSLLSIVFHLWMNLKFGVALSMFFATLELLQSVMYSNISIAGLWRYLPTAWTMEWKSDVISRTWNANLPFWGSCVLIILLAVTVFTVWFNRWEGRRK